MLLRYGYEWPILYERMALIAPLLHNYLVIWMHKGLSLDEYVNLLHHGVDVHQRLLELSREKEVHPWDDVCCESCWNAKEDLDLCVCKCGGQFHSRGIIKEDETLDQFSE